MTYKTRKKLKTALIVLGALIVVLGAALAISAWVFGDSIANDRANFRQAMHGDYLPGIGPRGFFHGGAFDAAPENRGKDGGIAGARCFIGPRAMHGRGGHFIPIVLGLVVIAFILHAMKRRAHRMGEHGMGEGCCERFESPVGILRRNYAEGKIDEEEFLAKLAVLRSKGGKS